MKNINISSDTMKNIWGCLVDNLAENITNIAGIATAISAIVALVTYIRGTKRMRIEKATQIAEIFARELSTKVGIIINLFDTMFDKDGLNTRSTSVKEYMFKKVNNKAQAFDDAEYNRIFKKEEREIIDSWFRFEGLSEEYIANYEILKSASLEERIERFDFFSEKYTAKEEGFKTIEMNCVVKELNGIIVELLNTLEFISMNFVKNIAHQDTAYQSLHQLFFCIVAILYPKIATNNIDGKDKYFTNIIALYKIWGKKYNKQIKKEKKLYVRLEKKRKKLERKINKIPEKTTCTSGSM